MDTAFAVRAGWFEAAEGRGRIRDNHGQGITRKVTVAGMPEAASIEAVEVEVDLDHPFPHDLAMRPASPARDSQYAESAVQRRPGRWISRRAASAGVC